MALQISDSSSEQESIEYLTAEVAKRLLSTAVDPKVRQITAKKLQGRWPLMNHKERIIRLKF
jgi:hypothetical protein